jgi:hypothetical protein
MKLVTVFCLAAAMLAAQDKTDSKTNSKKEKAPNTSTGEVKIPAGAVPTGDGSFKYTDEKGKKWIYRNTPFGVAKSEDKPVQPVKTQAEDDPTRAYEEGDYIRFEKPTPFGIAKWKKKKTDLDDNDRKIIDRQTSKK